MGRIWNGLIGRSCLGGGEGGVYREVGDGG